MIIGHRGAPGYRPEHSPASYHLALAQGAEAIEPDVVPSRDGVLVLRHDSELSETTDVADRPEFADRRTVKVVDGHRLEGWFTEDFDWAELATLRCRERIPQLRPDSAAQNDEETLWRLQDLLALLTPARTPAGDPVRLVLEVKHAAYYEAIGMPLAPLVHAELAAAGWDRQDAPLTIECFELRILRQLQALGVSAEYIFLMEERGTPADEVLFEGRPTTFEAYRSDASLARLAAEVDGVSFDKRIIVPVDRKGRGLPATDAVARAHAAGLRVYTWTLRPESPFLPTELRGEAAAGFGDYLPEWFAIFDSGVDGVFADHTDLALQARQHWCDIASRAPR